MSIFSNPFGNNKIPEINEPVVFETKVITGPARKKVDEEESAALKIKQAKCLEKRSKNPTVVNQLKYLKALMAEAQHDAFMRGEYGGGFDNLRRVLGDAIIMAKREAKDKTEKNDPAE